MERRNLIYYFILALLVIAIIFVGVLILRKRAMVGLGPDGGLGRSPVVETVPGTRSLESTPTEEAWAEGDETVKVEIERANWPGGAPQQ
ncbi:MAG: hypothetical protein ABII13_03705 [Patescibacteria group bacterium]